MSDLPGQGLGMEESVTENQKAFLDWCAVALTVFLLVGLFLWRLA